MTNNQWFKEIFDKVGQMPALANGLSFPNLDKTK